jgi:hypothetical protein
MADELGPALSHGKRELRCEPFAASRGPKLNPRLPAATTEAEREMRRAWPGSFSNRQRTLLGLKHSIKNTYFRRMTLNFNLIVYNHPHVHVQIS